MKHSDLEITLVGVFGCMMVVAGIFMVLFGQITMRKLRKNPVTRAALGLEFYSGYDILNVAEAVTLPRGVMRKFRATRTIGCLYADADLVYQHTSRFDRVLGRIFYSVFIFSGLGMISVMLLYFAGAFN